MERKQRKTFVQIEKDKMCLNGGTFSFPHGTFSIIEKETSFLTLDPSQKLNLPGSTSHNGIFPFWERLIYDFSERIPSLELYLNYSLKKIYCVTNDQVTTKRKGKQKEKDQEREIQRKNF